MIQQCCCCCCCCYHDVWLLWWCHGIVGGRWSPSLLVKMERGNGSPILDAGDGCGPWPFDRDWVSWSTTFWRYRRALSTKGREDRPSWLVVSTVHVLGILGIGVLVHMKDVPPSEPGFFFNWHFTFVENWSRFLTFLQWMVVNVSTVSRLDRDSESFWIFIEIQYFGFPTTTNEQRTTTTNRTLPTYDLVGTHHCSSDYQSSYHNFT